MLARAKATTPEQRLRLGGPKRESRVRCQREKRLERVERQAGGQRRRRQRRAPRAFAPSAIAPRTKGRQCQSERPQSSDLRPDDAPGLGARDTRRTTAAPRPPCRAPLPGAGSTPRPYAPRESATAAAAASTTGRARRSTGDLASRSDRTVLLCSRRPREKGSHGICHLARSRFLPARHLRWQTRLCRPMVERADYP